MRGHFVEKVGFATRIEDPTITQDALRDEKYLHEIRMAKSVLDVRNPESVTACQHNRVREIGHDFDKDGMFLRLIRCQQCGLLMREYLPQL
jgi:hypothetical protein